GHTQVLISNGCDTLTVNTIRSPFISIDKPVAKCSCNQLSVITENKFITIRQRKNREKYEKAAEPVTRFRRSSQKILAEKLFLSQERVHEALHLQGREVVRSLAAADQLDRPIGRAWRSDGG